MANNLVKISDLEITIRIGDEVVHRNLKEDLKVNEDHINEYLIANPGKTAYYNVLYQKMRNRADKIETTRKRLYAELDKRARAEHPDLKERALESIIITDEKYQKLEDLLLDAREQEGLLKASIEALRDLRSTLISLSANMRSEYGGNTISRSRTRSEIEATLKRHKIERDNDS